MVTSTSPARKRIPSSILVATTAPSKTSSSKRSRPLPTIRTTTPRGLRQTPFPADLKPVVLRSPISSGGGGGGATFGRLTDLAVFSESAAGRGAGLRKRACSSDSRRSSEPSSCSKKAEEIRLASRERLMQFGTVGVGFDGGVRAGREGLSAQRGHRTAARDPRREVYSSTAVATDRLEPDAGDAHRSDDNAKSASGVT